MNINWFTENYIENEKQCEQILTQAEIKFAYTKEQLFSGCFELRKGRIDKDSLETYIEILGKMSLIGIKAHIAGLKLREALFDSYPHNYQPPHLNT